MVTAGEARDQARGLKEGLVARMFGEAVAESVAPRRGLAGRLPAGSNVLGVGYGAKLRGGHAEGDMAVRVYVRTKLPRRELRREDLVPDDVDGVATDVVAVGDLAALSRPVLGGSSIGHVDVTAGTMGCLVELAGSPGERFVLSNNHVLADSNAATVGDPILAPGPIDGGDPDDPIAELHDFVMIDFDGPNEVDAAVARVRDPDDVRPELRTIGALAASPVDGALYQGVRKHGRTTQHTLGVVVDLAADIRVRFGTRTVEFVDQLAVVGAGSEFSQGGDSGSLVVEGPSRRPVGLLFAGGGGTTFMNPIATVLDAFDATIVTSSPAD